MSDHQVVILPRWRAVFEGADLSVRATDTDVEHAKHYLIRLGESGHFVLDDFDCFGSWKNCDCLHVVSFHTYIQEQQVYLVRARRFALLSPPFTGRYFIMMLRKRLRPHRGGGRVVRGGDACVALALLRHRIQIS